MVTQRCLFINKANDDINIGGCSRSDKFPFKLKDSVRDRTSDNLEKKNALKFRT